MARLARVVIPDIPHHVTQRGNRKLTTFFCHEDYERYLALFATQGKPCGIQVWAYCLMPNHVHMIVVPREPDSLARGLSEVYKRYSRGVNFREDWRGHLWQNRFASCPMDEAHTLMAARYVLQNPVRAGLVQRPWDWPYSSAGLHLAGRDDEVVSVAPLAGWIDDWEGFLGVEVKPKEVDHLELHQRTGRPLGSDGFVDALERQVGRSLRPGKPGPKLGPRTAARRKDP